MNRLLAFFVVLLALGGTAAAEAPDRLVIRVVGENWGNVDRQDIEAALYSVADALTPASGGRARTVVVAPTSQAPAVLYDHGEGGEYLVQLRARDANWNLYVYEFAHEYCHIVANYDRRTGSGRNQWFEESLCETASLYALKTLAETWQAAPPSKGTAAGSRQLRWFYDLLMAEDHRHLPAAGFGTWLRDNEDELRHDPYRRRLNEVVAARLLPLFENRGSWQALASLNLDPSDGDCDFDAYLDHWYGSAPVAEKAIVAAIRHALRRESAALVLAPR